MRDDLEIPFDRITYRDGQLLTALDLRDDLRRNSRLRCLHTRYLHETWGIAVGLDVRKDERGTVVIVTPGYAVDAMGRDLLLAEGIVVPVPKVTGPGAFVLTVSYQEDAAYQIRSDLAGVCLGGGLDLRHERPVFTWRQPHEVHFGPEIPLVKVDVSGGTIQGELDFRVRRNARPLTRPHIGWGTTEPGRTRWREWQESGRRRGLEVTVHTAAAGFTRPPYYFALDAFSHFDLGFITDVETESFVYRRLTSGQTTPAHAEESQWTISWLGIEPVAGCEAALDLARIFTLAGFPLLRLTPFAGGSED